MNSARYFALFHARTVAYLLVAASFSLGLWYDQQSTAHKLREQQQLTAARIVASQISACGRGNRLRQAVNTDTRIIRFFMGEIAQATAKRPGVAAKQRAATYRAFAKALIDVPVPNCSKVVYHP